MIGRSAGLARLALGPIFVLVAFGCDATPSSDEYCAIAMRLTNARQAVVASIDAATAGDAGLSQDLADAALVATQSADGILERIGAEPVPASGSGEVPMRRTEEAWQALRLYELHLVQAANALGPGGDGLAGATDELGVADAAAKTATMSAIPAGCFEPASPAASG